MMFSLRRVWFIFHDYSSAWLSPATEESTVSGLWNVNLNTSAQSTTCEWEGTSVWSFNHAVPHFHRCMFALQRMATIRPTLERGGVSTSFVFPTLLRTHTEPTVSCPLCGLLQKTGTFSPCSNHLLNLTRSGAVATVFRQPLDKPNVWEECMDDIVSTWNNQSIILCCKYTAALCCKVL